VNSVLPAAAEWSIDNALHSSFQLPDVVLVKKIHSAGGRGGEVFNEAQQELLDKPKAKSSGSKRREKRKQKQEKKMKELAEAADRMGLGGVGNEAGEDDWEQERKAFEEELKNDIELAAEFRSMVEKEIDMAKGALDSLLQEEEENNEAPE
jgi:transposase